MSLLREEDRKYIKQIFEEKLADDVNILFFTQNLNCQYCYDTERILQELVELSNKINLKKYNFAFEQEVAREFGVDKVPAIIITDKDQNIKGIRYFGIPSGYEFGSLIEDIIMVSRKDSDLPSNIREKLKEIKKPIQIKVFVTPTCPYCPRAVRIGHKFALENQHIISDMIESIEFPELADNYMVSAVPKIIINEEISFEGAIPEEQFLEYVLEANKEE
jgi:glutaredoxin-like protein